MVLDSESSVNHRVFDDGVRYEHKPFVNRWGAVARRHALAVQLDTGGTIAAFDLYKSVAELSLEIEHFTVIGPKLFFEIRPSDESGFPRIYTVQTSSFRNPSK